MTSLALSVVILFEACHSASRLWESLMAVRCELRVTVGITRLAEWCRTVIPSDRIFNLHQTTITDSFSCILFLWQQHLNLNVCEFYAKISTSLVKTCSFWLIHLTFMSERLAVNNVKNWCPDVKMTSWRHAYESSTPHVRQHFLAPVGFTEILVGFARRTLSSIQHHWHYWPFYLSETNLTLLMQFATFVTWVSTHHGCCSWHMSIPWGTQGTTHRRHANNDAHEIDDFIGCENDRSKNNFYDY